MAVTQKDIDDLEKAIASGAKKVKRGDREIEYRDLDEMRRTLGAMKDEYAGNTRKPYVYKDYSRGYQ